MKAVLYKALKNDSHSNVGEFAFHYSPFINLGS